MSGWRWDLEAPSNVPTISVIERTDADQHKASRRDAARRKKGAKKQPFGFSRVVPKRGKKAR